VLIFIKLGGSLVTDKRLENTFREPVATRVAAEIAAALNPSPDLRLLVGHGSGSFGHVAAKRYGTMDGVRTPEQWRGFAEVATIASELNYLMAKTLQSAGVPVFRMQPSASASSEDGKIQHMALDPIRQALRHRLVPLVYGDVSHDSVRGGTIISTETIFFYLAQNLPIQSPDLNVDQILLLGEVDGVYDDSGTVIPQITPANFDAIESALGGSAGTDVTGGMETKVRDMLALVRALPHLTIRIMNGTTPGLLERTLLGRASPGTAITAN
jgi:isopentenyl phosphate kinase